MRAKIRLVLIVVKVNYEYTVSQSWRIRVNVVFVNLVSRPNRPYLYQCQEATILLA